jgi:hypothetical protein
MTEGACADPREPWLYCYPDETSFENSVLGGHRTSPFPLPQAGEGNKKQTRLGSSRSKHSLAHSDGRGIG